DNIGFAIPIDSVQNIVKAIIEKGYITKPYIGVEIKNVSDELQRYGMPKGAVIANLQADGPAEKAGLQVDDIVTAINGEAITTYEDLAKRVSASEPGEELKFTVYRKGETLELTVTVGEKTQEALPQNQQNGQNQQNNQNQQGNQYQTNPYGGSSDFPWEWFFGG
ncbi:MAG: PDZ domain-containing protein, partial [Oscillospiraceae bacterium]|nr:PDZ domain-containing protein [Oscillospiraceae bacterium]